MEKKKYEIILERDLINKVDSVAEQAGKERSQVINDILGGYFSVGSLPLRGDILVETINRKAREYADFAVYYNKGDGAILLKSVIRHHHRPELKFSFVLADGIRSIGTVKLALRDNNVKSLRRFQQFVSDWAELEQYYLKDYVDMETARHIFDEGRFVRVLARPAADRDVSAETLGGAIGEYLHTIDNAVKLYFGMGDAGRPQLERLYRDFMRLGIIF